MKLHLLITTTLLGSTLLLASQTSKEEGIGYIKILGKTLKTQLKSHLKADPTGKSAMAFCATQAQTLTDEVNAKLPKGVSVRRTSLKTRNPLNIPDETDKKIMKAYEEAMAQKTFNPKDIRVVEVGDTTRVYKPLVTNGVCLKCHGTNIDSSIQKQITTHYPKDSAVGFKAGALRGVIVAQMKR